MKAVDLTTPKPTLRQVLDLAGGDAVVLRTREGREFLVSEIDDMDREVARVRQNAQLMDLLDRWFEGKRQYSMSEVREKLRKGGRQ